LRAHPRLTQALPRLRSLHDLDPAPEARFFHLLVDSVAALVSEAEIQAEMVYAHLGP